MSLNPLIDAKRKQLRKETERKRKKAKRLAKQIVREHRAVKLATNDLDAVSAAVTPGISPAVELAVSPAQSSSSEPVLVAGHRIAAAMRTQANLFWERHPKLRDWQPGEEIPKLSTSTDRMLDAPLNSAGFPTTSRKKLPIHSSLDEYGSGGRRQNPASAFISPAREESASPRFEMPSVSASTVSAASVAEAEVVADSGLSSRADDIGLALFSTSAINEIKGEVATLRAENAQMKESIRTMSAGFNKLDTTLAAARESIYVDNITIKDLTSKSNELLWQNTILLNQLKELVAQMVDTPTDEREDSPSAMSE